MPFTAQPTEKCVACGHTVYATERAVVEDLAEKKVYHKQCIRCQSCNKVLSVGQFSSLDGKFWCKPHFKQLFASKGNYDEPFGKEKRRDSVAPATPPTSFVPEVKSDTKSEKKQTSEETLAKFRKFREEGDTDKCTVCAKTVYLAEKLIVEDKNDKRLFHKTCFKCSVCSLTLDLRNYGSIDGKLFCKNHLKEQSKINAPSASVTISPSSFIPEVEKSNTQNNKETPEHIASKFKGLGTATDKCKACGKSVYATEKSVLTEGFGKQVTYHKQCLKCSICSVKLDVSNYGIANGILFCHVHLKQYGKPEQAKSADAYFVSPLASADPSYAPGPRDGDPSSFSNDPRDEDLSSSNIRESRDSDYENSTSDRNQSSTPELREQTEESERSQIRSSTERSATPELQKEETVRSSPVQERRSSIRDSTDDDSKKREEERQRKREERLRQQQEEERREEEEREKRRQAREQRLKEISTGNEESSSATSPSTGDDSDRSKREAEREERRKRREEERKREEEEREREEAKRRKEREERKKQQDELAARELEEQERKAEERRKRLEELKNSS